MTFHLKQLTPLRLLRRSALIEGATLLILVCVAVPLKHLGGYSGLVSVMGPLHGIAFMYYMWAISSVAPEAGLTRADFGRLLVGAVVPFGAWWSVRWMSARIAAGEA